MAVPAWPLDSCDERTFHFLRLPDGNPLPVVLLNHMDDLMYAGFQCHIHDLGHSLLQELQLPGLGPLDALMSGPLPIVRLAIVYIVHGRDFCITTFGAVISPDSERAVWTGPAAGTDSVAVAVKYVRCPAGFDGPLPESILEGQEVRKGLSWHDRWHNDDRGEIVW